MANGEVPEDEMAPNEVGCLADTTDLGVIGGWDSEVCMFETEFPEQWRARLPRSGLRGCGDACSADEAPGARSLPPQAE